MIDVTDPHWKEWRPASGYRNRWRVTRGYSPVEELLTKNGRRVLFRSFDAAKARADAMNKARQTPKPS